MEALFKKLNWKNPAQTWVIQSPPTFKPANDWLLSRTQLFTSIPPQESTSFALLFATKQAEIDHFVPLIDKQLSGDGLLWIAYPKGSSKRYQCDFNRDTGWEILGKLGYEPVRQVAIDEDWSALRFRRVQYIQKITRSKDFALTTEAKQRTTGK